MQERFQNMTPEEQAEAKQRKLERQKSRGGGGGGRPDMAQGGGVDPFKIDDALNSGTELVKEQCTNK